MKEVSAMAMEDEDMIVVFTDDDGNEYYYREDLVIELEDNKKFAVLIGVTPEGEDGCGCDDDDCECEGDVYIARIEADENGEETYVDPTDEEFEMVREAYEEILAEEEAEEETEEVKEK
jgi:uncharacterized protein YrzB (UPF0473 family)